MLRPNIDIRAQAIVTSVLLLFTISQQPYVGSFSIEKDSFFIQTTESDLNVKRQLNKPPETTADSNNGTSTDKSNDALSVSTAYAMVVDKSESKTVVISTTTPTPTLKPTPTSTTVQYKELTAYNVPSQIQSLIEKYAREYSTDPQLMLKIAKCESGYRAEAINGPYVGIYQFVSTTWVSNRNAMNLDPNPDLRFDLEESIKTAAFKMGRDGYGAWPVCSRI